MRRLQSLILLFTPLFFHSGFAAEDDFFNQICGVDQTFSIQHLYETEIRGKIIKGGGGPFCERFRREADLIVRDDPTIAQEMETDPFSSVLYDILKKNKDIEYTARNIDHSMRAVKNHFRSLTIGLVISKVWDQLSLEDRIRLRSNLACESASTYGKLPKFSDLANEAGPGNSSLVSEIIGLCNNAGQLPDLFQLVPRAVVLEAFTIMNDSRLDLFPYAQVYCTEVFKEYSIPENTLLESLGKSFEREGYLSDLDDLRSSFGLNSKFMRDNEFYWITKQNLTQEDKDGLFAWKGSGYIWMSNRDEFGLVGDIFSMFHQKGGSTRHPGSLRRSLNNLDNLLDRLPAHNGLVFRGTSDANPEETYAVGKEFSFSRYSSTSTNVSTARAFVPRNTEDAKGVLLVLLTNSGRNIMGEGPNSQEREVLFSAGANFEVLHTSEEDGRTVVYAVER